MSVAKRTKFIDHCRNCFRATNLQPARISGRYRTYAPRLHGLLPASSRGCPPPISRSSCSCDTWAENISAATCARSAARRADSKASARTKLQRRRKKRRQRLKEHMIKRTNPRNARSARRAGSQSATAPSRLAATSSVTHATPKQRSVTKNVLPRRGDLPRHVAVTRGKSVDRSFQRQEQIP